MYEVMKARLDEIDRLLGGHLVEWYRIELEKEYAAIQEQLRG